MKTKIKKMQDGGPADAMLKQQGKKVPTTKETMDYVRKNGSGYKPPVKKGYKNLIDDNKWSKETASPNAQKYQAGGGYANTTPGEIAKPPMKKGGTAKKMKTGGMVNPNAKVQAAKSAGSKGVKSGVNPKAAASKVAKGRSGGTSKAPKTALPKAQMGKIVKMTSKVAKAAGKGAKKASGSVLDFRKAATKSDMSKAFSNIERANLKKQLQDLEKAKKG
jgi:hypothetical protein